MASGTGTFCSGRLPCRQTVAISAECIAGWLAALKEPACEWRLIERAADLEAAKQAGQIGLIMGWQNMRPMGDRLDRLELFHRLGVRVMQITYNYRNALGDGCLETEDSGLSVLGRDAVKTMNQLGIASGSSTR